MRESPEFLALLKSLENPSLKLIDLSLQRVLAFLASIGNPHLRLPPVVHVAGTNGKGSTIAYLRAMLRAAGYACHVYTSPHLVHFRERIIVADEWLEEAALAEVFQEVKNQSERAGIPLTFFEATTLAAFLLFSRHAADVVLLETGMGGRLDATNVIPNPAATILTSISIDHAEFLGGSLAQIAGEKAAIMKAGSLAIAAPQAPEAAEVLQRCAGEIGATLLLGGKDWQVERQADGLRFEMQGKIADYPPPVLAGAHQFINAATALACAQALQALFTISEQAKAQGIANAIWPGRLQRLETGNLREALPTRLQLYVDGGHNPDAGKALAQWCAASDLPVYAVAAMMGRKDAAGFLTPLAPHLAGFVATGIPGEEGAMHPPALCEIAAACGVAKAQWAGGFREALATAARQANGGSARVLCTGSLYFAGHVLAENGGLLR